MYTTYGYLSRLRFAYVETRGATRPAWHFVKDLDWLSSDLNAVTIPYLLPGGSPEFSVDNIFLLILGIIPVIYVHIIEAI